MQPTRLPALLAFVLPCLFLCQCQDGLQPASSLTRRTKDPRKVIYERYYTMNGHRMVERRVIVTTKPRLETDFYSEVLD